MWKKIIKEINSFDKKIDMTNPFSEENYRYKKYSTLHNFYSPSKEHVQLWVDDLND